MQDESTADMIFDVAALVSYASSLVALRPGDVILTGSPAGNGMHHRRFLQSGDVIEATITGLGAQDNLCVSEAPMKLALVTGARAASGVPVPSAWPPTATAS